MQIEDYELSIDDLSDFDFESIINNLEDKSGYSQSFLFFSEQNLLTEGTVDWKICGLFGAITQFSLNHEQTEEVFIPMFEMAGKRGILPQDFSENQLAIFAHFLPKLKNPCLRARVADVLWTLKHGQKPYLYAQIAIDAYFALCEELLNSGEDQVYVIEYVKRGMAIVWNINHAESQAFLKRVENWLDLQGLKKVVYHRLVKFLLKQNHLPAKKHLETIERHYSQSLSDEDYWSTERVCDLLILWYAVAKDEELKKKYLVKKAELFVLVAKHNLEANNAMAAVSYFKDAIDLYRQIGGFESTIAQLRQEMMDSQARVSNEMKVFSSSLDISEFVEATTAAIKGKDKRTAILTLISFSPGPSKAVIKNQVEKEQFSLTGVIDHEVLDSKGRTTAKRASSTDEDRRAQSLEADMFSRANIYREMYISAQIWPAMRQLSLEHIILEKDLDFIIEGNPIIPRDRTALFRKGFLAGFRYDFVTATHILVLQLENSFRVLLNNNGVITTGLSQEGIEEEFDLNRLLEMKELKNIFGEDLIFHLKGLLTNRFGVNLRNRVAHGLLSSEEFLSTACLYLWWLVLKICTIPFLQRLQNEKEEV
jgi:hypothetical protein